MNSLARKMIETRPDPDQLLEKIKEEELPSTRGKLRIFLGASAATQPTQLIFTNFSEQIRWACLR